MPSLSSLFAAFRLTPSRVSPADVLHTDDSAGLSPKTPSSLPDGPTPRRATAHANDLAPRTALPDTKTQKPKHEPYYSEKPDRWNSVQLNGKVPYPGAPEGSNEVIECRHLALTWASQLQATGKPDYKALNSEEAIRKNVRPDVGALNFRLLTSAPEVHLVPLQNWGEFVAGQLKSLEAAGDPAAKQLLVGSVNHSMALELKVKPDADGNGMRYVANFYDPNLTATHKRMASNDIAHFEALKISDLLLDRSTLDDYFGDESIAMVMALPPGGPASLPARPGAEPERRLAGPVPPLDRSVIDPLLTYGFAGTLRDIKDQVVELARQDPAKAEHALAVQSWDGTAGLTLAMVDGHKHAVGAFVDLVAATGLPKPVQMSLLKAQAPENLLNIDSVMGTAWLESARAYCDGLARHPSLNGNDRALLMDLRDANGLSPMAFAMISGTPDTVAALAAQIAHLDVAPETRCRMLIARDGEGVQALGDAMACNAADRVAAYVTAVLDSPMSDQEKMHVLQADAPPGGLLTEARQQGASLAIDAYRNAVRGSTLPASAKAVLLCEPPRLQPQHQPQRQPQAAH